MLRSADDPFRLLEPRAGGERGFADRSFSYVAPRMYDRLPIHIKQLDSVDSFKKQLKSYLFNCVYDLTSRTVNEDYKV